MSRLAAANRHSVTGRAVARTGVTSCQPRRARDKTLPKGSRNVHVGALREERGTVAHCLLSGADFDDRRTSMNMKREENEKPKPGSATSAQPAFEASMTNRAQSKGAELATRAKEQAGAWKQEAEHQASAVAESARGVLEETARTNKDRVAGRVSGIATALYSAEVAMRNANEPMMSDAARAAAEQVEKVGHYLEAQDIDGLIRDAQNFGRRNPAMMLGGAFTIGLFLGRFLKSSE